MVAGQELKTTALFFQPLDFAGGWYHLRLPMVLPPGSGIEYNPPPPCSATILINTGTPGQVKLGNLSHKFQARRSVCLGPPSGAEGGFSLAPRNLDSGRGPAPRLPLLL